MKRLLLLSLLFIGCGPSGPMPSDISIFEIPSDETLDRWANKIDTIWKDVRDNEFAGFIIDEWELLPNESDRERFKIKYSDITWQLAYDMMKAVYVDSTYFNFENLNKYDSEEEYIDATFPRFAEYRNEIYCFYDIDEYCD